MLNNDNNNNYLNSKKRISNSLAIVIGFVGFSMVGFSMFMFLTIFPFTYDNCWNKNICLLCIIIVVALLTVCCYKTNKIIIGLLIFFILAFIVNQIYYMFFSMRIEPKIYLSNKYNFSYSEMKVLKTEASSVNFLEENTPRSAVIKYKAYEIETYYNNRKKSWEDDYNPNVKNGNIKKEYLMKINNILEKYSNKDNYKIYTKQTTGNNYSYAIYLYTMDSEIVTNVIKELDNYVDYYSLEGMHYTIYVLKNKDIYDKLSNARINNSYDNNLFPYRILESVGYKVKEISSHEEYYKEEFFTDYYKDSFGSKHLDSYKYIAFTYEDRGYGPRCYVYGLYKE